MNQHRYRTRVFLAREASSDGHVSEVFGRRYDEPAFDAKSGALDVTPHPQVSIIAASTIPGTMNAYYLLYCPSRARLAGLDHESSGSGLGRHR